jgi:hypothetical protein
VIFKMTPINFLVKSRISWVMSRLGTQWNKNYL